MLKKFWKKKTLERPQKRSQSFSWNAPREYSWDPPKPYNSSYLKPPEHFQNSLPVSRLEIQILPSSHRPPHLSGQTPLLRVDFGVDFCSFLLVFSTVFGQFFWSKTAKIDSKSAPLEGIALGAWRSRGGDLWLEVRSQSAGNSNQHLGASRPKSTLQGSVLANLRDRKST